MDTSRKSADKYFDCFNLATGNWIACVKAEDEIEAISIASRRHCVAANFIRAELRNR